MCNRSASHERPHPAALPARALALGVALLLVLAPPLRAQYTLAAAAFTSGGATSATGGAYTLTSAIGQPTAGPLTGGGYSGGAGFIYQLGGGGAAVMAYVDVRAFLQGAYTGGSPAQRADLAAGGHLPLTDPYGQGQSVAAGFFASAPGNEVVDWVKAELRSGNPASPPMTIVSTTAGFLLRDGSLAGTDATTELCFPGVDASDGPFFLVIHHRNHLGVLSSVQVPLSAAAGPAGAPYDHDFTTAMAQAFGTNPMKNLGGGAFGLWAADGDGDGQVTAPDFNLFNTATAAGAIGYQAADYDGDGQVTAPDFNLFNSNTTAGASSQVPAAN